MTVKKIFENLGLVNDNTRIFIRHDDGKRELLLACGNWYQDDILEYLNCKVENFTWQDDNFLYIDLVDIKSCIKDC